MSIICNDGGKYCTTIQGWTGLGKLLRDIIY